MEDISDDVINWRLGVRMRDDAVRRNFTRICFSIIRVSVNWIISV